MNTLAAMVINHFESNALFAIFEVTALLWLACMLVNYVFDHLFIFWKASYYGNKSALKTARKRVYVSRMPKRNV